MRIIRSVSFLFVLLLSVQLSAQNSLTVTVNGVEIKEGTILIALFDSADSFMKDGIAYKKVEVKGNTEQVVFTDLSDGQYAVILYQDENNNRKLDLGEYGIPKEKYGFSNNVKANFGPPSFEACKFEVKDNTRINIELK